MVERENIYLLPKVMRHALIKGFKLVSIRVPAKWKWQAQKETVFATNYSLKQEAACPGACCATSVGRTQMPKQKQQRAEISMQQQMGFGRRPLTFHNQVPELGNSVSGNG